MKINIMPLCLSLLFFSLLIQYAEKIKISETAPDSIESVEIRGFSKKRFRKPEGFVSTRLF